MAKRDPPNWEGRVKKRHKRLLKAFHRYDRKIEAIIDRLESDQDADLVQTERYIRKLVSTSKQLLDAEIEIDELHHRKKGGSPGQGAPIDIDAARASIGQRLDCLRKPGGSGGVHKNTH